MLINITSESLIEQLSNIADFKNIDFVSIDTVSRKVTYTREHYGFKEIVLDNLYVEVTFGAERAMIKLELTYKGVNYKVDDITM